MSYLQQLIPAINHPLLRIPLRRLLWIDDYRHPVVKLTPNACHVYLGEGKYKAILYVNNQYDEAARKNLGWLLSLAHAFDIKVNRLKPAWNLGFDEYSSQPGSEGLDTRILSSSPTSNYGTQTLLAVGEPNDAPGIYRTLVQFDLSSIPSSPSISAGTLSLYQVTDRSSNARTFRVYRQKRAWVESEATWNIYSTGNSWSSAGGFGADDCEQTDICDVAMSASETNNEFKDLELDGQSSDYAELEAMCGNSPSFTNNGFLIKADTESDDCYQYSSSDEATASQRPKLAITYAPSTAAPTIFGNILAVTATPSIGLYDVRYKLRAKQRDTALG